MRIISRSLCIVVAALYLSAPVHAITNGSPDGDAHPNVGTVVHAPDGRLSAGCSAVLVGPRTVLTVAHCVELRAQAALGPVAGVTFASDASSIEGLSTYIPGRVQLHPQWTGKVGSMPYDIAVIQLDHPAPAVPADLPEIGLLNSVRVQGHAFPSVGYGFLGFVHEKGAGAPYPIMSWVRHQAVSYGASLTPTFLHLSQNAVRDHGGPCLADSGGPHFIGDTNTVVALAQGGDARCRAYDASVRLDTPSALSFIASVS